LPSQKRSPDPAAAGFSVVFEGYAGGAEHWPLHEMTKYVLFGAVFSEADDCARLVQTL
jgi:hypothetical protein